MWVILGTIKTARRSRSFESRKELRSRLPSLFPRRLAHLHDSTPLRCLFITLTCPIRLPYTKSLGTERVEDSGFFDRRTRNQLNPIDRSLYISLVRTWISYPRLQFGRRGGENGKERGTEFIVRKLWRVRGNALFVEGRRLEVGRRVKILTSTGRGKVDGLRRERVFVRRTTHYFPLFATLAHFLDIAIGCSCLESALVRTPESEREEEGARTLFWSKSSRSSWDLPSITEPKFLFSFVLSFLSYSSLHSPYTTSSYTQTAITLPVWERLASSNNTQILFVKLLCQLCLFRSFLVMTTTPTPLVRLTTKQLRNSPVLTICGVKIGSLLKVRFLFTSI